MTTVLQLEPLTVLYDGRATAEADWFETIGLAVEQDGVLMAVGDWPVVRRRSMARSDA